MEVTVEEFVEHVGDPLRIKVLGGVTGLGRPLRSSRIQKPGLALAGYSAFVHHDRLQILGQTELSYLATLDAAVRRASISHFLSLDLSCVLVTKDLPIPPELAEACESTGTPLLRTSLPSSILIRRVLTYLDDLLTPRSSVHGVLVDVDGVGVLMTGVSGIGKSECALDLVLRGHRLVADDVVDIRRRGEDLVGQAAELIRHLIEIRGLGILNVAELYGVAATRDHKRVEVHIELEDWRADRQYDRLGLEERTKNVLGVEIQSLLLPVRPGRDIAAIVEVAARNFLLLTRGHHAARDLSAKIDNELNTRRGRRVRSPEVLKQIEEARRGSSHLRAAASLTHPTDHLEDEIE